MKRFLNVGGWGCRSIPQSLLLLSRAFKIQTVKVADGKAAGTRDTKEATVESLKNTFNMLPDDTLEDVTMETFKSTASLEQRLEYLQRVEQDIKDENEETEELKAARTSVEARPLCPPPPLSPSPFLPVRPHVYASLPPHLSSWSALVHIYVHEGDAGDVGDVGTKRPRSLACCCVAFDVV